MRMSPIAADVVAKCAFAVMFAELIPAPTSRIVLAVLAVGAFLVALPSLRNAP